MGQDRTNIPRKQSFEEDDRGGSGAGGAAETPIG